MEVVAHPAFRLQYSCDEAQTKLFKNHAKGVMKSPCCLNELGEGVRTVMRECKVCIAYSLCIKLYDLHFHLHIV